MHDACSISSDTSQAGGIDPVDENREPQFDNTRDCCMTALFPLFLLFALTILGIVLCKVPLLALFLCGGLIGCFFGFVVFWFVDAVAEPLRG